MRPNKPCPALPCPGLSALSKPANSAKFAISLARAFAQPFSAAGAAKKQSRDAQVQMRSMLATLQGPLFAIIVYYYKQFNVRVHYYHHCHHYHHHKSSGGNINKHPRQNLMVCLY
jgi:hypothetical protein